GALERLLGRAAFARHRVDPLRRSLLEGHAHDDGERRERAVVVRSQIEHLGVGLVRPVEIARSRAEDLAHLEADRGAHLPLVGQLVDALGDVEQLLPALGLLVEARERGERLVVLPEAREQIVVGDDRVLRVGELLLVDRADAAGDGLLLVLVGDRGVARREHVDELLPLALLLVEPLERAHRIDVARIELAAPGSCRISPRRSASRPSRRRFSSTSSSSRTWRRRSSASWAWSPLPRWIRSSARDAPSTVSASSGSTAMSRVYALSASSTSP